MIPTIQDQQIRIIAMSCQNISDNTYRWLDIVGHMG